VVSQIPLDGPQILIELPFIGRNHEQLMQQLFAALPVLRLDGLLKVRDHFVVAGNQRIVGT
jgi:hypothetical protein